MKNSYQVILKATLVMLLWGSLFPCIKLGYRYLEIDSGHIPSLLLFAGVRFLLCGLLLTGFCTARRERMRLSSKKDLLPLAMVALFAVVLHYACTYTGLSMVESGKTALLKQLGALLFICFSFLFFKEDQFSIFKLIAAGVGLCGIIVLNLDGESFGVTLGIGEILVILASFCTVISNVSGKRLTRTMPPLVMTGYSQLAGGVVLCLIGLLARGSLGTLSWQGALVFCYILLASTLGYGLWYSLLRENDLSKLFIIKFLEPVFAAVFGILLLGEQFSVCYLIAFVLTVAAILISHLEKKKT
ncbi:MAG: EamA family transporter [Clostridia bacterium]|nr:EamA family transporter [Clostridia bacterium]